MYSDALGGTPTHLGALEWIPGVPLQAFERSPPRRCLGIFTFRRVRDAVHKFYRMPPTDRLFRFGDFTFNPESGELTDSGRATRLQPQVAALLTTLAERAGTVVTRTDLQARLWPDTTVEFDDGLNFCIRQLRVALGDDAAAPRFIETLPKRGYRFLPPVTAESGVNRATGPAPAQPQAPTPGGVRRRSWSTVVAPITLLILAGVGLLAKFGQLPGQHHAAPRPVLGVLGFATDTTDSMMVAYRRRVTDQIIADSRAENAWDTVTHDTGATYLLSGALTRDGKSVKIFVQLLSATDRHHVWADDIVDAYAFSGNSTIMGDRIEKSVARALSAGAK